MPFKVGKLDISITIIVFIVFFWATFIDSFRPELDQNGDTIPNPDYPINAPYPYVTHINMQVFIGSIILIYEMFQLIVLPGKRRGRELPWRLYYQIAKDAIRNKLRSGTQEYHEWKKTK